MMQTVQFYRAAISAMLKGPWTEFWLAAPRLEAETVSLFLPLLRREGARILLLTDLSPARVEAGEVDTEALLALVGLPGCAIRSLPGLHACLYAAGPAGPALVGSASLTMEGMDEPHHGGLLVAEAGPILMQLADWWTSAQPMDAPAIGRLATQAVARRRARALGEEIARVGAFVRVSVKGTRRTRRLDPREFGVPEEIRGPGLRPAEVQFYKLDDVIRAKDELEAVLAEQGLEWNGYYLVPRQFLEHDWPRLFGVRQRQLADWLGSPEAQALLREQLGRARASLERYLGGLLPAADSGALGPEAWIDQQATRILAEAVSDSILEESGLEYRVLTILPEDERSVEEVGRLLQDPKLRSVQLTFHF